MLVLPFKKLPPSAVESEESPVDWEQFHSKRPPRPHQAAGRCWGQKGVKKILLFITLDNKPQFWNFERWINLSLEEIKTSSDCDNIGFVWLPAWWWSAWQVCIQIQVLKNSSWGPTDIIQTSYVHILFGIEHKAKYQRKMIHLPRLAPVFGHVEELNLSDNNFTWFDHEEEDEVDKWMLIWRQ